MTMGREGVAVGAWPFGRREVPFDEMVALEGATVLLRSGESVRLARAQLEPLVQVLQGPDLAGGWSAAATAFAAYLKGQWSPRRAARALLELCAREQVSDVHLEPGTDSVGIRLRSCGELVPFCSIPAAEGQRLTAAFKSLAGALPYRRDLVQEGRIPREGVAADVRASFVPTPLGERVALRLFGQLLALEALGFEAALLRSLEEVLALPSGLVLVAGASGAGKTTTLYSCLAHLAARRPGAHLSLEDPVEQRLRAARVPVDQLELEPARGFTGEAALVAALRQDIDVLSVGELRTPGEAALAVKAAHTGRLVLAGLHAGTVDEARQRMLDLGVEPGLLGQTVRAVLHQRLRTSACPSHRPEGCPSCKGRGRVRRLDAALWRQAGDAR